MFKRLLLSTAVVAAGFAMTSCKTTGAGTAGLSESIAADVAVPEIPREYRAAWVATVANIDWPSTRELSTEQQKAEAIAILDKAKEVNLNAIVFQVRPHCDAMYQSSIEPWSEYLTAEQGKAPDPYYDPLEFWCTEAHKRGIQLHTWFNPYRAHHPSAKTMSDKSLVKTRPDLVAKLGDKGYYWMIPTEPDVQKISLDVVLDVVKRYDVDGVHFDDYFYPYSSYNDEKDFPDDISWNKYQASGGKLSRGDWRRKAVDDFVKSIHEGVRREKPWVLFGMSPFGIWKPENPPGIKGLNQYESLFADAKLWLNEGWVDYYTPQLYWKIEGPQSYTALLDWWIGENTKQVHIWPGNSMGHFKEREDGSGNELLHQITETRNRFPAASGNTFFSFKSFNREGVSETFKREVYQQPALIPASPWIDNKAPAAPAVRVSAGGGSGELQLTMKPGDKETPAFWAIQSLGSDGWKTDIIGGSALDYVLVHEGVSAFAVSAVDRAGNESKKTIVKL